MKPPHFLAASAIFSALLFVACGAQQTKESPVPPAVVDSATAASISGIVTLAGPPPALRPIDMSAAPACVQMNPSPVASPVVIVGENGALANVVIYVKDGLQNYRFDAPNDPVVLDQRACMYSPHVVALMTGQPLEIRNEDPTMHDVHPLSLRNRQWHASQPAGAAALKTAFARPELAIPMLCSAHPWMQSFIFAFDHPYFAVTSTTGQFELRNLPPGTYTIEAWHEKYKTLDQTVTLAPRESKSVSFTFSAAAASIR
jgi:carboxypeptidase family protein